METIYKKFRYITLFQNQTFVNIHGLFPVLGVKTIGTYSLVFTFVDTISWSMLLGLKTMMTE